MKKLKYKVLPLLALVGLSTTIGVTTYANQATTRTTIQIDEVTNIPEKNNNIYYTSPADVVAAMSGENTPDVATFDTENPDIITVTTSVTPLTHFTFDASTNTIITYSSSTDAPKEVIIPAQIYGYDILHIADYAFSGFQLTSLSFEEGSKLQTIGEYAFYNNLALIGVVDLPESLETIGYNAFKWTNIYALGIGENTTYTESRLGIIQDYELTTNATADLAKSRNETALVIGEREYDEETAVLIDTSTSTLIRHYPEHLDNPTTVTVPEGIKHIGAKAYYQDTHITEVIFASTIESIEEYAFYQTYIEHIDLSNTILTRVEKYAFGYSALTEVLSVPTTLEYIGQNAFERLYALTHINGLEDSALEEIGSSAFMYSSLLESFNMPDTVHTVGASALSGSGITSLDIPPLLLVLPKSLVSGASSLTEVTFYGPVEELGTEVFGGTKLLTEIKSELYDNPFESVKKVGSAIFCQSGSLYNSAAKVYSGYKEVVTLPNVEEVLELAFSCTYVPEVHITSQKLTELSERMFYLNTYLTVVTIPESITSVGASIFNGTYKSPMKLGEIRLVKADGTIVEHYNSFPEGVTEIPANAFSYCETLPNFVVQDTVTAIGSTAFYNCESISYFRLGDRVETIGGNAFGTGNVTLDIYIDQYVDNIEGAPWGNSNAWVIWNGLVIADKLDDEDEIEVQYLLELREDGTTANLKSMRDTKGSDRYAHYIAHEVWDRNDRTKPYYITHIPDGAFTGRNSASSLVIEEGIIYIGDNAFSSSYYLLNISLPAGLEYLGTYAFSSAGWYTSTQGTLTIGEGIDTIPEGCFNSARYFHHVNLPHSILYVEKNAFGGTMSSMTTLKFTNRVEFDESGTGTLPSSLTSLYLPAYSSTEEVPGLEAANLSKQTQIVYYGDAYEYVTDQGSIWFHADTETVFKYIGTSEVVDIPETIEIDGVEHTVSRIDDYFLQSSNRTITEIFVPSTVEYIGEKAFYQSSTTLELIYLNKPEDSLEGAPWENTGKGLLILWNNSLKIGDYYYRIQEDGTINIIKYRGKATSLDVNEFNSLFEVDPGYVITKIEENAFYENSLLKDIILPESVDIIGDYAFAYCSALESIQLPEEMAAYGLGSNVFTSCVKLKEIHLPSGIVNTGDALGLNCTALELVTVPLDITEIGANFVRGTPYTNKNMIVKFLDRLESNPVQSESWTYYRQSSGSSYTYYQGLILYEDRILRDGWVYSTTSNTILNYYVFTNNESQIEFPTSFIDDNGHTSYVKNIDGNVTGNGDSVNSRYPYNNIQYADTIIVPTGIEVLGGVYLKQF